MKKKKISHQEISDICHRAYFDRTFEEANIEVLIERNVIAFRGTDEPMDAVRDLRIFPLWTKELGWCPAGFLKASKRLITKVMSECWTRGIKPEDMILTGHSLGGACALIVGALMVRDEFYPSEIVTFGAPRCGRLKILDNTAVTMYRHGRDIVPLLPPLMRRHKPNKRFGQPTSFIKDHLMIHYQNMSYIKELEARKNGK